jgi:molybdate transport system ATP-binding protein
VKARLPLDRFVLELDESVGGGVTGIFGPSGSGKTSLLEMIAGLRSPAIAHVSLDGETWEDGEAGKRLRPEQRRVGLVPQDALLFPHLDVRRNLLSGVRRDRAVFHRVVSVLSLQSVLDREVGNLSGGERQRVALGRALCSKPRLLLLDEPLSAVDLSMRGRLLAFLRETRRSFDIPMLVVSHDPLVVQALADDVIVIERGRVRARGKPGSVLTDPAVFPLAEAGGFRNVMPCVVEGPATARLGTGGTGSTIHTLPTHAAAGSEAILAFPAGDVLLAVHEPHGLSARNVIPATVGEVSAVGDMRLVHCRLEDSLPEIVAELTPEACRDLGISRGKAVYLVIKAAACAVLGG